MAKLTQKEREYLEELKSRAQKKEHTTHRVLADRFGLKSVASSWQYARALEKKGYEIREVKIFVVTRAKAA